MKNHECGQNGAISNIEWFKGVPKSHETFVQKLRLQVFVSINEKYFPFPDDEAIHPAVQYSY